eukprot:gene6580-3416_t
MSPIGTAPVGVPFTGGESVSESCRPKTQHTAEKYPNPPCCATV